LHKLNLLTVLDVGPFSAYCCAYAHWQQEEALQGSGGLTRGPPEGHPRVNPLVRIASQAMDDMRRIGAEFGLAPNARLRLSGITPSPSKSKFDGLLK
jgi:P27 family predicted phage terminase small subunit